LSISAIIFLADVMIGFVVLAFQLSWLGVVGDLLLVEVAILAILGGLTEFSRAKGVYEARRVIFGSEEEFSTSKHLEASRKAVVFFSPALMLLLILIVIALIERAFVMS
jgi:hypothetical protein